MVSDYATWEAKAGLKFRFHMKQTTDTAVTSQTDGEAKLEQAGGPGEAHYTVPEDATNRCQPARCSRWRTPPRSSPAPVGKKFLALPLFDGTDDFGAEDSSLSCSTGKSRRRTFPAAFGPAQHACSPGFFRPQQQCEVPTYQVGMRYWENGVADDLQMDLVTS